MPQMFSDCHRYSLHATHVKLMPRMHTVFRVHACAHTCAPYVVAEGESSHAGYEDGNQSLSAGFVACRHVSRRTGNATTDRTFSVCGISTTKGNTLSRIDTVLSLTFHF